MRHQNDEKGQPLRASREEQDLDLDPRSNSNPLDLASKFLRKPVENTLLHLVTRFLSRLPTFSEARQARFAKSAGKRDFRWLAQRLAEMVAAGIGLSASEQERMHVQFDGFMGLHRRQVAGSAWHTAIIRALSAIDRDLDSLPTVTISFVTFNSARWLDGLCKSLVAQDYPLSKINVSFVDNGSSDETVRMIEEFTRTNSTRFSSIRLFRQENLGFGAGHDVSFRNSTDEFVLVSNVDLVFHKTSLVGAVKVALADLESVASWELRQCPYEHPKFYDPVTLETSWSSHACILIRRAAYMDVGGYEDRIFMYGEDVELSYRFRGAGYKTRYLPQVTVTHFVDFTDVELRPDQFSGSISANLLLRYRYGSSDTADDGERLLSHLIRTETDEKRREALRKVVRNVDRDRDFFSNARRPRSSSHFPFNGLDYELARLGHDMPLQSSEAIDGPLVTIVTRTHGPNISILSEAIASVCNQSYRNIEHLIVEDRTSYAQHLVSDLRTKYQRNIRYVKSEGGGRSVAGNTGLKEATGELVMFLDNDDLLFGDHVEMLAKALIEHPEAPAAYALAWELPTFYDQNGRYREGVPVHVPYHARAFSAEQLQKMNFLPIQSVLFRRRLFEQFGGFDLEIDYLEDWNLWCRYSQAGNFHYVPKTTSIYRVPGDLVFRSVREQVMRDAEPDVRKKNSLSFDRR